MEGLSKKIYLELSAPTEEDSRSDQQRILEALSAEGIEEQVHMPVHILRMIYPLVENAKWKITVSLGWNGENWEILDIEAGNQTGHHYGLAVDLGSTTVVARLLDCVSGRVVKEVSCFNARSSGERISFPGFFTVRIIPGSWKKCGRLRWTPLRNAWIS